LKATNPWIVQYLGSRFAHVGLIITLSTKVQIPPLVNTLSIRRWKKLNVDERSACSCYCPIWKLMSCTMATKMSEITSWIHVCSLPYAQCKRWILIRSMGCVQTHRKRLVIDGCGSLNYIQSIVEKIGEDWMNYKLETHPKVETW